MARLDTTPQTSSRLMHDATSRSSASWCQPLKKSACAEYGLPYVTGRLHRQYGQVVRTLARLAVPPRVLSWFRSRSR